MSRCCLCMPVCALWLAVAVAVCSACTCSAWCCVLRLPPPSLSPAAPTATCQCAMLPAARACLPACASQWLPAHACSRSPQAKHCRLSPPGPAWLACAERWETPTSRRRGGWWRQSRTLRAWSCARTPTPSCCLAGAQQRCRCMPAALHSLWCCTLPVPPRLPHHPPLQRSRRHALGPCSLLPTCLPARPPACSDGLFDVMSGQEAVDAASRVLASSKANLSSQFPACYACCACCPHAILAAQPA